MSYRSRMVRHAKPLEDDTADDPENDTKFTYLWNCKEASSTVCEAMVILAVDGDGPAWEGAWNTSSQDE